eukprot:665928-Hanusia_phi.AAC.2
MALVQSSALTTRESSYSTGTFLRLTASASTGLAAGPAAAGPGEVEKVADLALPALDGLEGVLHLEPPDRRDL